MSFPRYPKYRDSDVEWLGEVPAHWDIVKVRHLCTIKKRIAGALGLNVLSVTQQGIKIKDTESNEGQLSMDYSKYQLVDVGDFAMNHMDLLTGWVDIAGLPGVTSPDYRVFSVLDSSRTDARYLLRVLQMGYTNKILFAYGQGSSHLGRWRLPTQKFNDLPFPLPPSGEQARIASFLDREIAKVNALIAEQQRLVELLKEKRQAVISHAVTTGLNPDAPMKSSGVDWLGHVPTHWSVTAVRRVIADIEQGWSPDCIARAAEGSEWGVLKSGCVNRGTFDEQENKALPEEMEPIPAYEVRAGDVLMSRASGSPQLIGSTAYVSGVRPHLMLSDKIFRIHLENEMGREFFVLLFNSAIMRYQIERAISGADGLANNLPQSALLAFTAPVPPLEEQCAIVAYASTECAAFESLAAEAEHAIALLQERRTALISAAVTGKIDVRGLVDAEAV